MNRRRFLTATATLGAAAALPVTRAFSAPNESNAADVKGLPTEKYKLTPPANGAIIQVALVISEGVNVIDFSGPWGVFSSVMLGGGTDHTMHMTPFDLITVSDKTELVRLAHELAVPTEGLDHLIAAAHRFRNKLPMLVTDELRQRIVVLFEDVPKVFQVFKPLSIQQLVCLLSGKAATTHHDYLDKLQREYPDIQVKRGVRFVEGEKISTAGGLTSGTDLALRVVERYFGRETAQTAATYMEYQGKGWIV